MKLLDTKISEYTHTTQLFLNSPVYSFIFKICSVSAKKFKSVSKNLQQFEKKDIDTVLLGFMSKLEQKLYEWPFGM